VATGLKWASGWRVATNLMVLLAATHSVTTLDGLDEPWNLLTRFLEDLRVETLPAAAVYVASGRARAAAARNAQDPTEGGHQDV